MSSLPPGPQDGRGPWEAPTTDWRSAQVPPPPPGTTPPPGTPPSPGTQPRDPAAPQYDAGAVQTQSQPGWQPLVAQTSDARRVARLVVAGLLVVGWLRDELHVSAHAVPGLSLAWSLAGLAGLATLVLLVGGPQPRLATKWAWFWLLGVGPLGVAFLLLEPVPVWLRDALPARTRLTGGWAFLLMIAAGILASTLSGVGALLLHSWGWFGLVG